MPKISIIVPVYKVEKYLRKCIESILNQTFKDFELILVDDGSPDRCGEICEEYVLQDNRVKVIHKKNGGQSSARNMGLDIAQGKYIGFIDSDDWIEPDMYEILYKLVSESQKDIANIGFSFIYNNGDRKNYSNHERIVLSKDEAMKELIIGRLYGNYFCVNLFKREVINNFRFKEGIKYEDIDLMYQIVDKSNGIITVGESKYNYLQRENGTVGSSKKLNLIDCQVAHYNREKFLKNNYYKLYKEEYKYIYNEMRFWRVYDTLLNLLCIELNQENDRKIEKLIEMLNYYLLKNLKLNIPFKIKLQLILLKFNKNIFKRLKRGKN